MAWLTDQERVALSALGVALLVGVGVLLWQRQKAPLVIETSPAPIEAAQWDEALRRARQVDINTAGVAELERLPGVGPSLAQRIVEDRQANGSFESPEALARVKGIGPKTYETLKEYLVAR